MQARSFGLMSLHGSLCSLHIEFLTTHDWRVRAHVVESPSGSADDAIVSLHQMSSARSDQNPRNSENLRKRCREKKDGPLGKERGEVGSRWLEMSRTEALQDCSESDYILSRGYVWEAKTTSRQSST